MATSGSLSPGLTERKRSIVPSRSRTSLSKAATDCRLLSKSSIVEAKQVRRSDCRGQRDSALCQNHNRSTGRRGWVLVLLRDLILLQFPVRHFVGPYPQVLLREFCPVDAQSHAAAKTLANLIELLRTPQGCKATGDVLQRLFAEVTVSVIGEQRSINGPMLQAIENFASLLQLGSGCRVVYCQ